MFNNFFSENRTVYEIMSKNIVKTEGPQMTSQYGAYALRAGLARLSARMRMHTATRSGTHVHARTRKHAHTGKYVILMVFPRQQWFHERASMLRYTYMACHVALTSTITHFTFIITALHSYCNFHRTSTQTDHKILYAGRTVGWKSIYVTLKRTRGLH